MLCIVFFRQCLAPNDAILQTAFESILKKESLGGQFNDIVCQPSTIYQELISNLFLRIESVILYKYSMS